MNTPIAMVIPVRSSSESLTTANYFPVFTVSSVPAFTRLCTAAKRHMNAYRSVAAGVVALAFLPFTVHAQGRAASSADTSRRPVAGAVPRSGSIAIDGRLDEAAWQAAPAITHFTQQQPNEGAPPTQKTDVRILYDNAAIYIGARMYEAGGAAAVTSRLTRHDNSPNSDILRIDFDPYHDRLHSVEFDVNPAGWRGDATGYDRSWDPVWEAAGHVDSLGWTAEVRIPFSQLRFSADSLQTWGLNLTRITQRTQERDQWAFWRQNQPGGPAFFGTLTGLNLHARPSRLELLPYGVIRSTRLTPDASNPLYNPHNSNLRLGGDLKYLATSNLTLSATVNPDFGQVEVDPAVINLSAFETYFPEKRPFFVEGASLFEFGQPGCNINCGLGLDLFYSRRVGRAPEGASLAYAAGRYTDVPENTTILGAAKLTGRTAGGYTIGVMDALTRGASAPVLATGGQRLVQAVEPRTNDFVGRVTREMRGGNLVLGGVATSVYRDLTDPGLTSLLDRHAEVAGLDGQLSWGNRTYMLYGAVAASDAGGDSSAIRRLQRSSARYLQRPDRRAGSNGLFSNAYDPSATTLRGYSSIARLVKQSGTWLWDVNAANVSPGFEANDLGFLQQADYRWLNGTVGPQFTHPTRLYRNLQLLAGAEQFWNYDGDVTSRDATALASAQLPNYWRTFFLVQRSGGAFADRLTRGGPVVRQAGSLFTLFQVSTDPRRRFILGTSPSSSRADDGGFSRGVDLSLTWRPASNISLTADPRISASRLAAQYVRGITDSTAISFYGRRYVFAHLDQRAVSMTTRASVTFTPGLSLDMFAQPLLASGHYTQFEEFAAPRQLRKLVYGQDVGTIIATGSGAALKYTVDPDGAGPGIPFTLNNPDFNVRSLRGTAVLRWEYRPGSTAYLVWTQTRNDGAQFGNLSFDRDRTALFSAHPDNIFLLKVSYWLGL